nr:MAG TPA: hypothetical protein [Caudoviricetes sp.]
MIVKRIPQRGRTAQSGPAPLPRQPAGANLKSKRRFEP